MIDVIMSTATATATVVEMSRMEVDPDAELGSGGGKISIAQIQSIGNMLTTSDLRMEEKVHCDLEGGSSVFEPPSSPRTLQDSSIDDEQDDEQDGGDDDESSVSSKRLKVGLGRWIRPIAIDMSESNPDWWKIHWPNYKGPGKSFDVSTIFEPLQDVFSCSQSQSEEPVAFQLPFEIRHFVAGVTTGKDGEYVGPSGKQGRSGRRHRLLNKFIPKPPQSPKPRKQKCGKGSKGTSGTAAPADDEWETLSDLTSLSDLSDSEDRLSAMDDDSDAESVLTTLSELEEEFNRKPSQPRLIGNFPIASPAELKYFEPLSKNVLPTRNSGLAGFMEGQRRCFCADGSKSLDNPKLACREASRCINRFMNVECPPMECGAGETCGNQRIQNEEFSKVAVVTTRRKGFGLRSEGGIAEGSLVCEYTGEVVNGQQAEKRLRKYMKKRNKHIYMMELQKGEYIDATVKGGIARFANHSCNPNCEIQQWVVGEWLRMVLVAKRDILTHEEITFNYNMNFMGDSKVQKCFCREKGCSGFIGRAHVARKKEQDKAVSVLTVPPPAASIPPNPPSLPGNKENHPPPPSLLSDPPPPKPSGLKIAEEKHALDSSSTGRVLRSRACKT